MLSHPCARRPNVPRTDGGPPQLRGDRFMEGDDMIPMLRNRFANPAQFESSLEPWSDLRREIDRLFDSMVSGPSSSGVQGAQGMQSWMPLMDIADDDDQLRL